MIISISGCDKLCNPKGTQVQPGYTYIPPMARQSSGLWTQLHKQRGRRQLRTCHALSIRNIKYAILQSNISEFLWNDAVNSCNVQQFRLKFQQLILVR